MADDRGQPAQEEEKREAQRPQPGPEAGEEHPFELGACVGQGAILQRPRVERVAPREPFRLVSRAQDDAGARPPLDGAGSVRMQHKGPESAVESHPVAGAQRHRVPAVVADGAGDTSGDDHSAHAVEHCGEAGGRGREQAPARTQLELETPACRERGRVGSEQTHRQHDLVVLAGDLERFRDADALDRQIGFERHDPYTRVLRAVGREAQPLEIHGLTGAAEVEPRLRRIVVAGEADRRPRCHVGLSAGRMAGPPHDGAGGSPEGHAAGGTDTVTARRVDGDGKNDRAHEESQPRRYR